MYKRITNMVFTRMSFYTKQMHIECSHNPTKDPACGMLSTTNLKKTSPLSQKEGHLNSAMLYHGRMTWILNFICNVKMRVSFHNSVRDNFTMT